jgi:antitoxin PrlF
MATVTTKGQVTIPKRVREALGIRAGTELEFEIEGNSVRLRKVESRRAIERWRGTLELPEPVDDFVAGLRGDR